MVLEAKEEGVRIARSEQRLVKFWSVVEVRAVERKSVAFVCELRRRSWRLPVRR